MCGIAGIIHRGKSTNVGGEMQKMLQSLKHRGPDSTGYALYGSGKSKDFILRFKVGENVGEGSSAFMEDASLYDLRKTQVNIKIEEAGGKILKEEQITPYSFRYIIKCDDDLLDLAKKIETVEMTEILSLGQSLELIKDLGDASVVADQYSLNNFNGTHGIGHTRMATESAITTQGSHPYSTSEDECLVHNGSLSNHNNVRRSLIKDGQNFNSENDTEVAAGYISNQISKGKGLEKTLKNSLKDLDGFYTFIAGTKDGFALLRDEIACKPAVVAETKDYVAVASEFQAMAHLPNVNSAKIFEPKPGVVYHW